MVVRIEFYGIPRERAGVSATDVEACTLGEALSLLSQRFPALGVDCLAGNRLRRGFVANLNGDRFVADPEIRLSPSDCLLILGADVGG